jgi:hypothetical protein
MLSEKILEPIAKGVWYLALKDSWLSIPLFIFLTVVAVIIAPIDWIERLFGRGN